MQEQEILDFVKKSNLSEANKSILSNDVLTVIKRINDVGGEVNMSIRVCYSESNLKLEARIDSQTMTVLFDSMVIPFYFYSEEHKETFMEVDEIILNINRIAMESV